MEFRKREIKIPKAVRPDRGNRPPPEAPPQNVKKEISSNGTNSMEDRRFIVVQVSCELFEYSNLRKIEYVGSFDCKDRNYEQDKRLALFAYDVNECDPKELLNYWKTELENINKTATYTMRTIKVPVYKPNDEEEL